MGKLLDALAAEGKPTLDVGKINKETGTVITTQSQQFSILNESPKTIETKPLTLGVDLTLKENNQNGGGFVDSVGNLLTSVGNGVVGIASGIGTGLINSAVNTVGNIANNAINTVENVANTAVNTVNNVAGTINNISNTASSFASKLGSGELLNGVSDKIDNISKNIENSLNPKKILTNDPKSVANISDKFKVARNTLIKTSAGEFKLFEIGFPCKFNSQVDPEGRTCAYLQSKMHVIDLIPCDYQLAYKEMLDAFTDSTKITGGIHRLSYERRIEEYKNICKFHGLGENWAGLRILTTDDTTMSENINVQYRDNALQTMANSLADKTGIYRDMARSIAGPDTMNQLTSSVKQLASEAIDQVNTTSSTGNKAKQFVKSLANVGAEMAMLGYRTNFAKVWQSSNYNSTLGASVKLVSPYGDPKAIKEFIIRPFLHLLLLIAPHTTNGLLYGDNIPLTIKAYGLEYLALGAISAITFNRGGSDTSFNLYRQPLTIDIRLEFQPLCDGFAIFKPKSADDKELEQKAPNEYNLFEQSWIYKPDAVEKLPTTTFLFKTASTILQSLKPIQFGVDPKNFHEYGPFSRPVDELPSYSAFTPLSGNLGSSISGTVNKISNIMDTISNADKLISAGISGAIYDASKKTVNKITSGATSAINSVGDTISRVDTGMQNIFNLKRP